MNKKQMQLKQERLAINVASDDCGLTKISTPKKPRAKPKICLVDTFSSSHK